MKTKLIPVTDLIKSSLAVYFKKENLIYVVKFVLLGLLTILISILLGGIIGAASAAFFASGQSSSTSGFLFLPAILGILILLGLILAVGSWLQIVQIKVLGQLTKNNTRGLLETFKRSWDKKVWVFFLASFIAVFLVVIGFILLVIPGIILAIWFSFSPYVVVEEDKGVISALKRSRELVSGYFWPVLGRYLVFLILSAIVQIGVSAIPFAGPIVAIFLGPYFVLLPYLLYKDLVRVKGSEGRVREAGSASH